MIMAWRDREGWLNFMFLGDGRAWAQERERSEEMGEIIMRNWDLREFCARVTLPSLIPQVRDLIRQVIIPIQALPTAIRLVLPLISQIRSYPPYRSDLDSPSLSFSSTTLPSLQEHEVKSSLSISPCHHHESTPSAPYAECSIHRAQHRPEIVCRPVILSIAS